MICLLLEHTSVYKSYLYFAGIYIGESVPLVVFGIAKIQRVKMLAELSGLKLEAELRKVHTSGTHKKKVKGLKCILIYSIVRLVLEKRAVILL